MLLTLSKFKLPYLLATLLLAWLTLFPTVNRLFLASAANTRTPAISIIAQTPCAKTRIAQAQKICPYQMLYDLSQKAVLIGSTLFNKARIYFPYLTNLMSSDYIHFIFKPPKAYAFS